jgi:hypothetical protein
MEPTNTVLFVFSVLWTELRILSMLSKHSTTELHPCAPLILPVSLLGRNKKGVLCKLLDSELKAKHSQKREFIIRLEIKPALTKLQLK